MASESGAGADGIVAHDSLIDRLKAAHRASLWNELALRSSQVCGCFDCVRIFSPTEITAWIDEGEEKPRTAWCPYCEMDTVLAEQSGFPINEAFLRIMQAYWFSEVEEDEDA